MLKGKITKAERDALSADLQKEYKALLKDNVAQKDAQGNEIFIIDTPDMEHKDDIGGLKSALENERTQNTERGVKIIGLETAATSAASELAIWKNKNPKADESAIESAKQELITKHTADLDGVNKKSEGYRNALDKALRVDAARAAIVSAKGIADLLLPHVLESTKFVENADGTFKIQVVNKMGGERVGDSAGNPMTLDQLVAEMKSNETFGRAFEGTGAGGSGAINNQSGGLANGVRTIQSTDRDGMNASLEDIASGKAVVVE